MLILARGKVRKNKTNPSYAEAKISENHLYPVMLVFIG